MATPTERLESLNQAIDDGVRQVTIDGQTVTYNTTDSLIRARDDLKRRIAAETNAVSPRPPSRQTMLYYSGRGYK
jgi:hypothetical protein